MQDIDMETYGRSSSPAAGDTQVLDSNSYQQEDSGAYVHQELLDNASPEAVVEAPVERTANPQAENFRALREEVDRIKTEREAAEAAPPSPPPTAALAADSARHHQCQKINCQ